MAQIVKFERARQMNGAVYAARTAFSTILWRPEHIRWLARFMEEHGLLITASGNGNKAHTTAHPVFALAFRLPRPQERPMEVHVKARAYRAARWTEWLTYGIRERIRDCGTIAPPISDAEAAGIGAFAVESRMVILGEYYKERVCFQTFLEKYAWKRTVQQSPVSVLCEQAYQMITRGLPLSHGR